MTKNKFKQTEIGYIPNNWEFVSLIKKCNIIMGQSPESKYYNLFEQGTPFLQGITTFGDKYPIINTWTTNITKLAKKGSVLFSVRAPVGEVNICNIDTCIGRGLLSINSENNEFIYYLCKAFKKYIVNKETGTVYGSVTQEDVKNILLPFPPLPEQKAIAKILSDLDEKIELNRKMNQTLEEIGKTLFKRWFVDFEFPNEKGEPYKSSGGEMVYNEKLKKEMPKGWSVGKLGVQLKTILGGTPSTTNKNYWDGNIPWINSGAINDFPVILPTSYITEKGVNESAAKLMPIKTIVLPFVISVDKEIKISLTAIETTGNQSVLGILQNAELSAEYIYYYINSIIPDIYSSATGGAQQHINKAVVDNSYILLPNREILKRYNNMLIPIFNNIFNNSYEIRELAKIRDSLLPKLMSGKIRTI